MNNIFDTKPDFVNAEGVKWWVDKSTTEYARTADQLGTTLPDLQVWIVERPDGYRTRLFIENQGIVWEGQSLEAAGTKIDMLKMIKRAEK